jgi:uncharacterized Zn finger protein
MNWDGEFKSKPKKPAPKRGIKVRKIGATWWGQRWIEALEHLSREYLNRLGRGRAYARAGRVFDLDVKPGIVTAKVTGSDSEPYDVTLRIAMLPPALWQKAIAAMGQQVRRRAACRPHARNHRRSISCGRSQFVHHQTA